MARADRPTRDGRLLVYRHPLLVRATHWVNALCLLVLLMSGLQILSAHPAFYWGDVSTFARPFMAVGSGMDARGGTRGMFRLLDYHADTTGFLGAVKDSSGQIQAQAFPSWATLPSYHDLGEGRRWHFFFAWALVLNAGLYLAQGLLSGRLRREMLPSRDQLGRIGQTIWEHLRLHFPKGEEARHYNVLQKLAYLAVIGGLAPLMVLTGLAMSPGMDAWIHGLPAVFGGRQSARTIHFLVASTLVLFFVVHILMVLLAGPLNELRSMVTGWFAIRPQAEEKP